ncbi:DUF6300 family protein [Streptomyces sp. bgisy100]|uniref:DUF6300 family protein n=1 Tax=Streptomyces sp. bgisy100 TaxID=3413783 RepID=UPI003D709E71
MIKEQPDGDEILLKLEEVPPCPRCGGVALLLAQFPHAWRNGRDAAVSGLKEALLCPACDHGEPAAADLLALFAVDDQVGLDNLEVARRLLSAWVESVRHRTVDEEALSEEFDQWSRGEL